MAAGAADAAPFLPAALLLDAAAFGSLLRPGEKRENKPVAGADADADEADFDPSLEEDEPEEESIPFVSESPSSLISSAEPTCNHNHNNSGGSNTARQ
jgi:hypothetical protein